MGDVLTRVLSVQIQKRKEEGTVNPMRLSHCGPVKVLRHPVIDSY